jgi:hypothetical protein
MERSGQPAAHYRSERWMLDNLTLDQMRVLIAVLTIAAMSIHSFVQPGVFESEAIAAISETFDAACKELNDTGQPQIVLEVIAERIIAAASIGERDPVRSREAALLGFGERGLAT